MSSIIDRAFTQAYNEVAEHYNNDELEECVRKGKEILDDDAAPRYHRIKTWILLGNVLEWDEANACFLRAEAMWRLVRRWHRVGHDAQADEAIEELRISLDELKEALDVDRPLNDDPETAVEDAIATHDANVEEERRLAPNDDEEELERVEAAMGFTSSSAPPKFETPTAAEVAHTGAPTSELAMHPKSTQPDEKARDSAQGLSETYVPSQRSYGLGGGQRVEEILRKSSWRPDPTS
ncbi:unnamed protein product [Zymoseptoria tritici ST99CH_1E4]|uniref:Uncharacterized protein n=1 Tax=Zymoseptoria tritici ST99CH_1E4 TaxID=1276532 RepID=A0A2H1FN17_ZYMTR|nr:unnamed protein product [Zymoseptoria tritici ST99CH_1E4]